MHKITTFTENKTALTKLKGISSSLYPTGMMDKWKAYATLIIRDAPREHQIAAKKKPTWQKAIKLAAKDHVLLELWHALIIIEPVLNDSMKEAYTRLLPSDTFHPNFGFAVRESVYFFLADHHLKKNEQAASAATADAAAAQ